MVLKQIETKMNEPFPSRRGITDAVRLLSSLDLSARPAQKKKVVGAIAHLCKLMLMEHISVWEVQRAIVSGWLR